jgi:hypothetical protein
MGRLGGKESTSDRPKEKRGAEGKKDELSRDTETGHVARCRPPPLVYSLVGSREKLTLLSQQCE